MTPRRILYLHHGGAIGGAPLSLLALVDRIDRSRFEPVVATIAEGPAADLFRARGVETIVVEDMSDFSHTELQWYGGAEIWRLAGQAARYPRSVAACRALLRRVRPDLVHLNSTTLAAGARAARAERLPVIWHVREPLAAGYTGLRRAWLRRRIDRDADRVVAISAFDAGRLRPSPRIRVIHNFVDFGTFDRGLDAGEARAALGIPAGRPVVTMLGGVARAKGTRAFVEAARRLVRERPGAVFLVAGPPACVGSPSAAKALAKRVLGLDAYDREVLARAAGVGGAIRFLGVRLDVPRILAATDVLVFPASVPHFGRPLIEAAAMAKPAVASRLGPSPELVEDGVSGLLVPPENPEALAAAVDGILADPARARAMGEAAHARARLLFDAGENARRTFDVYAEILP